MGQTNELLPRPYIRNCLSPSNLYIRQGPSYRENDTKASFCLLHFQKTEFKGIGENKAFLTMLKADSHISVAQFAYLTATEFCVSLNAHNCNIGNIDLWFLGLLGLGRNNWRFENESGSDKIRLFGYFLNGTMP